MTTIEAKEKYLKLLDSEAELLSDLSDIRVEIDKSYLEWRELLEKELFENEKVKFTVDDINFYKHIVDISQHLRNGDIVVCSSLATMKIAEILLRSIRPEIYIYFEAIA